MPHEALPRVPGPAARRGAILDGPRKRTMQEDADAEEPRIGNLIGLARLRRAHGLCALRPVRARVRAVPAVHFPARRRDRPRRGFRAGGAARSRARPGVGSMPCWWRWRCCRRRRACRAGTCGCRACRRSGCRPAGRASITCCESFPLRETLQTVLSGSGECAQVDWTLLGLAMPAWVLISVVTLGVFGVWNNWRRVASGRGGSGSRRGASGRESRAVHVFHRLDIRSRRRARRSCESTR